MILEKIYVHCRTYYMVLIIIFSRFWLCFLWDLYVLIVDKLSHPSFSDKARSKGALFHHVWPNPNIKVNLLCLATRHELNKWVHGNQSADHFKTLISNDFYFLFHAYGLWALGLTTEWGLDSKYSLNPWN